MDIYILKSERAIEHLGQIETVPMFKFHTQKKFPIMDIRSSRSSFE